MVGIEYDVIFLFDSAMLFMEITCLEHDVFSILECICLSWVVSRTSLTIMLVSLYTYVVSRRSILAQGIIYRYQTQRYIIR